MVEKTSAPRNEILGLPIRQVAERDYVADLLDDGTEGSKILRRASFLTSAIWEFLISTEDKGYRIVTVKDFIDYFEGKNAKQELLDIPRWGKVTIETLDTFFKKLGIEFNLEGGIHSPSLFEDTDLDFVERRVTDPDQVSLLEDYEIVEAKAPEVARAWRATIRELAAKLKK
jgi:hypothetical protein